MHYTQRKTPFSLSVKRSASGLGVYTNEPIAKRRFIIEYWGDLVTDDEANRIGGKYLFELGNGKTINGTTRKNIARYINHSCRPNCEVEVVGNKVFVFSRKTIKAGEELTYNYGKDYFNEFIGKKCRCPKHT
jgi:SET domain-containing protein